MRSDSFQRKEVCLPRGKKTGSGITASGIVCHEHIRRSRLSETTRPAVADKSLLRVQNRVYVLYKTGLIDIDFGIQSNPESFIGRIDESSHVQQSPGIWKQISCRFHSTIQRAASESHCPVFCCFDSNSFTSWNNAYSTRRIISQSGIAWAVRRVNFV